MHTLHISLEALLSKSIVALIMRLDQWLIMIFLISAIVLAIVLPVTLVNPQPNSGGAGQDAGSGNYEWMVPAAVNACNPNPPPGPSVGYEQVRTWSNTIFAQAIDEQVYDPEGLSTFAWGLAQFVDHDIVRSGEDTTGKPNIIIPFSPGYTLTVKRLQTRSGIGTTLNSAGCHEIQTEISATIDATTVYGDYRNMTHMNLLRSFQRGKLRMQARQYLPYTDDTKTNFLAGDVRAGEHALLGRFIILITVFFICLLVVLLLLLLLFRSKNGRIKCIKVSNAR